MWSRDVEGLEQYTDVHNKSKYSKFAYNAEKFYLDITDTEIYDYIFMELIKKIPHKERTINSKCIIEHIMANLLWNHYKNWLNVAKQLHCSEINMKEKIPFYLIKKEKDPKKTNQNFM